MEMLNDFGFGINEEEKNIFHWSFALLALR